MTQNPNRNMAKGQEQKRNERRPDENKAVRPENAQKNVQKTEKPQKRRAGYACEAGGKVRVDSRHEGERQAGDEDGSQAGDKAGSQGTGEV